eukprot:TRINITY_DN2481_c0_g3_i2.p1 TRINITY_DN2481_c0_g3~~TRINITY_DN2481_c0_g3_i2.p1  ORF type:complete len:450 (+),score=112.88 TRINITY_DN2481_c0_g3_i2:118-1467(+)
MIHSTFPSTLPRTSMVPAPFGLYSTKDASQSLPLTALHFRAHIKNCLNTVEVTQHFVNLDKTGVEYEYSFPIDKYTTTVTALTVTIGDKVLEAKVMEKEKAEEKYTDAIAQGNTAIKIDQDENQPDLVRILVGNLFPKQEAIVTVRYVKLLGIEESSWCFRIPVVYFPEGEEKQLEYKWDASVTIESTKGITKLSSPSHMISMEFKDENRKAIVTLTNQFRNTGTDLILLFQTSDPGKASVLLQKLPSDEYHAALVSFYPTFGEGTSSENALKEFEISGSGEYIFILDCSGSMSGNRIKQAKSALDMLLRSLPVNSKFNIVCFGSNCEFFKPASLYYDPSTLQEALNYLKDISANLGGTDLYKPLAEVIKLPFSPSHPRSLFVLTDGDVDDSKAVIDIIKKSHHNMRVHSFGIGADASRDLVKGAAIAGHGSFQFVKAGEDITPKVMQY